MLKMKKLTLIAVLTSFIVPAMAMAAGLLGSETISIGMEIDRTVVLNLDQPELQLHQQLDGSGNPSFDYEGSVIVSMSNNSPVLVTVSISPIVPIGAALSSNWTCDIAAFGQVLTYSSSTEVEAFGPDSGVPQQFWVGAQAQNVNISAWPADQNGNLVTVAEITVTVVDNI